MSVFSLCCEVLSKPLLFCQVFFFLIRCSLIEKFFKVTKYWLGMHLHFDSKPESCNSVRLKPCHKKRRHPHEVRQHWRSIGIKPILRQLETT